MLCKSHLHRIERVSLIAVRIRNGHSLICKFFWILNVRIGCFRDRFSSVGVQERFWVKRLHVAHAAIHKEPYHALRLRYGMRFQQRLCRDDSWAIESR